MLYNACRALYDTAFPGEPEAFTKALFDRYFPHCLRVIQEGEQPVAMLFSVPYPLATPSGITEAHYLYAVATHPDHRGKGLAKQLLQQEAARYPVFLRPMTPSLFDFYEKAGFKPLSPIRTQRGEAAPNGDGCRLLTPQEYLARRDSVAPMPRCCPTSDFLSLYETGGGFVETEGALALYEKNGKEILFKEYWGDPVSAPRLAAFLGGERFELRRYDKDGTPFGMGAGMPYEAAFLAALD